MGEGKRSALRIDFDGQICLEFHGANVTSDAGLLAYRELDETLGLTTEVEELGIHDPRTGQNTQHSVTAMVRQSVYSRLAGYEDTNDAERLCVDPAMRRIVGGRATEKTAASTSQVGRFETQVLTESDNLTQLMDLSGRWIDQVRRRKRMPEAILDLDSSVSPTHGGQEGTAYNGHFECTCYHPLFCFNQFGDLERTVRSQTRFAAFLGVWSASGKATMVPCHGMTRHLRISSAQPTAGAVRTNSIWEMSI
jgi:hypothetical protein